MPVVPVGPTSPDAAGPITGSGPIREAKRNPALDGEYNAECDEGLGINQWYGGGILCADGDSTVGFGDVLAILTAWGPCGEPCRHKTKRGRRFAAPAS